MEKFGIAQKNTAAFEGGTGMKAAYILDGEIHVSEVIEYGPGSKCCDPRLSGKTLSQ
jgi:hypothetical protein